MTKEPGTEAGGRRDEGQTRRGRMIDEVRHTHETRVTGEVLRYRRNLMAKNMSRLNPSCHLMISGSVVNRSHVAPRLTSLFPLVIPFRFPFTP